MRVIETSDGYEVRETTDGLDISINGVFRLELSGYRLNDYELDEDDEDAIAFEVEGETIYINEYKLEKDIEFEMNFQ